MNMNFEIENTLEYVKEKLNLCFSKGKWLSALGMNFVWFRRRM